MKLFNQFSLLPTSFNLFNYAGEKMKETPKEFEKCLPKNKNFWEKECIEHQTYGYCLIYCDLGQIFNPNKPQKGGKYNPFLFTSRYIFMS